MTLSVAIYSIMFLLTTLGFIKASKIELPESDEFMCYTKVTAQRNAKRVL